MLTSKVRFSALSLRCGSGSPGVSPTELTWNIGVFWKGSQGKLQHLSPFRAGGKYLGDKWEWAGMAVGTWGAQYTISRRESLLSIATSSSFQGHLLFRLKILYFKVFIASYFSNIM